jgi:hypothetical protein
LQLAFAWLISFLPAAVNNNQLRLRTPEYFAARFMLQKRRSKTALKTKTFLAVCLTLATGVLPSQASAPFMPLHLPPAGSPPVAAPVVDEPLGARSSLGLTLWHLGHNTDAIAGFHQFLEKRNIKPESLLPSALKAPDDARRILIEPERLPEAQRNGWVVQNEYLAGSAYDNGPDVDIPLAVERAGLYRGWVRFNGSPAGTGVTALRIYRVGHEAEGPILNDEFYDYAVEVAGPNWKDFLVDLLPGKYTIRLSYVVRRWHAGKGPAGYIPRAIDLFYFTDEIWQNAPSDETLQAVRGTGNGVQLSASPALSPQDKVQWLKWQVRPLSWEDALTQPRWFALSREYWQQHVQEIGKRDYGTDVPDYRVPQRQIIFDDSYNLVCNPVQARRRIETLQSDLIATPSKHFWYWLQAGDLQNLGRGWVKQDTTLLGPYLDFGSIASGSVDVAQPGEYSAWVRFYKLNGYYAPWRLDVESEGGQKVTFDHDQKSYESEWRKVGVLKIEKAGQVQFKITPLNLKEGPATHRRIFDFLLTTDPDFVPQGNTRPPTSMAQYSARAKALGAKENDAVLAWLPPDSYTPLSQEVWDDNAWPAPLKNGEAAPPLQRKMAIPQNSRRSVQVGLRNLRATPLQFKISGGDLRGASGNFPGRVSWRVVGFIPTGESSRNWSPMLLMRRASVTVPPYGVAGVWLTVDSKGVAPGNYTSQIVVESAGVPARKIDLQITVAAPAKPQQPILVSGWTGVPEGEIYVDDYVAHGLNVWQGEMSKAEMQKRGIRLLVNQIWKADEAEIRARIARFKALGLEYSDWVFSVMDEPHGKNEEELKPFIDIAKTIKRVDPNARVLFNPGEAATAATFETLAPYADMWLPFAVHLSYNDAGGDGARRRAVFTGKPWWWYTTPDYYDQRPSFPKEIYAQIRSVPAQPGNPFGTVFFAYYYPFRDAWDLGHEFLPDAGVTVLPSRHGPVATRQLEAIAEATVHANLAQAVKEKSGGVNGDDATAKLIVEGTIEELLARLKDGR